MEPKKARIQFTISEDDYDGELNLPAGNYLADVKEVNSTDPVQYQILHLDCKEACDKKPFEEQLILMQHQNGEKCWLEAHHNSKSKTIQVIGKAIEQAFNL